MNASPSSSFITGEKLERLPTPDGGQEVVAARFMHPTAVLDECRARRIILMPPQLYLVSALASLLIGNLNVPEQREGVAAVAKGPFGRMSIHPRTLHGAAPAGWTVSTWPGDESRGGPKGRLHRAFVKFGKRGVGCVFYAC